MRAVLAAVAALVPILSSVAAQPEDFELESVEHVLVDDVHPGAKGEERVEIFFRALTRYRLPVENLRRVDVRVTEDDERVAPERVVSLERFEDSGLGMTCVIALDTSRTMMGEPFERARAAAQKFLLRLGRDDRAAILTFSSTVDVLADFELPLEETRALLAGLEPDREAMSTVVYDGIHGAVDLIRNRPGLPRRGLVVVFSDGRDGGSDRTLEDVTGLARGGASEPRVPIFTIGYAGRGGGGLDALRRIAAETGADSTRAVDLEAFYDDVLRQIRSSYVLHYEADMDGALHRVGIAVEQSADSRPVTYPLLVSLDTGVGLRAAGWVAGVLLAAAALALAFRPRTAARLRFESGPRSGEVLKLRTGATRIGALTDNDIVLDAPSISRVHAEIRAEGGELVLVDLGSTNGTRVNEAPITSTVLRAGDQILFGEIEAKVEI